jgi:predicted phage tail protein
MEVRHDLPTNLRKAYLLQKKRRKEMEIGEMIKKIIQEMVMPELQLILPEIQAIKSENEQIKTALAVMNKRIDDMNNHLVDQSRRIDNLRVELRDEIANLRVELRDEIANLRTELRDENANLKAELKNEITNLRVELRDGIDKNNMRIDRLYEVIVRRDEYEKLEIKILRLENEVAEVRTDMKIRLAA